MSNNSTFDNKSQSNDSTLTDADPGVYPDGAAIAWILLIITIFTLIGDAILMYTYCKFRHLRTAFSVYLINLFIGDFVQALIVGPGTFVLYLFNGWPLGRTACSIYLYVWWMSSGFLFAIHLTISVNRLWAVSFPVHYRTYHNKAVAAGICTVVWIYAHILTLPAIIPDALYYRPDSTADCAMNYDAQPTWSVWSNLLGYDLPEVLILLLYPITVYKVWKISKTRAKVKPKTQRSIALSEMDTEATQGQPTNLGSKGENSRNPYKIRTDDDSERSETARKNKEKEAQLKHRRRMSHFKVLHLLVFGVIVCWTPLNVYYTLAGFMTYYNFAFLSMVNVLYYGNSLINPICYPLASEEWRKAVKQVLRW